MEKIKKLSRDVNTLLNHKDFCNKNFMLFTKLNKRLDDEFLLIFAKLKTIEHKLDTLLARVESNNPEDLLSPSEIAMMHSWRNQAKAMESEEPN